MDESCRTHNMCDIGTYDTHTHAHTQAHTHTHTHKHTRRWMSHGRVCIGHESWPRVHHICECARYGWVISHMWMRQMTYEWVLLYMDESCRTHGVLTTHTHAHTHTHMHTHMHTHTYTHTHTHSTILYMLIESCACYVSIYASCACVSYIASHMHAHDPWPQLYWYIATYSQAHYTYVHVYSYIASDTKAHDTCVHMYSYIANEFIHSEWYAGAWYVCTYVLIQSEWCAGT